MTAIIKQDVIEFSSDLEAVTDPAWAAILAMVNRIDGSGIDKRGGESSPTLRLARIYLAAHFAMVSLRAASGAVGPVTSEAAGQVRTSYATLAIAARDAPLAATPWGMQYLALIAMTDAHGPVLV